MSHVMSHAMGAKLDSTHRDILPIMPLNILKHAFKNATICYYFAND